MHLHPGDTNRPGHVATLSQDTNASGIAESTISFSAFPQPPASIPTTPVLSEFGTSSPSRSTFSARSTPLGPRKPLPVPSTSNASTFSFPPRNKASGSNLSTRSGKSAASATHLPSSLRQQPVSPYDWHDGASSIGMDATEDRLLSTSFITSLLQENSATDRRKSIASDAMSGFSEMTYPPLASSFADDTIGSSSSAMKHLPHRRQAARPPPSSFAPIPEPSTRLSGDSATLYGADHDATVLRKASVTQSVPRASVVGVASATLHNLSSNTNLHAPSYDNDDSPRYSDVQTFLPQDLGVAMPRHTRAHPSTSQPRTSMHSTRSTAPSFISRISSHPSVRRVLAWRKAKPLPPVPLIPHIPIATELEHRRADEMMPLPDLVNRADALQGFLEKGYHPHHSITSYSYYTTQKGEGLTSTFDDADTVPPAATAAQPPPSRNPLAPQWARRPEGTAQLRSMPPNKRRTFIVLGVFLVICLVAVGTAVGITVGRKKASVACDALAQNIIDLVPSLNRVFLLNLTDNDVYNNLWLAQGSVSGNCASQSVLVDVAPALTSQMSVNVTQWAQTALLWNIVESQDLEATTALQKFIQAAPWQTLGSNSNTTLFSTSVSGYTFNFASQEVTHPNVSFVTIGQPTAAQLSNVGSIAQSTLDRMYSFASASSTQHQKALKNYWTGVLQQDLDDLPHFMAAFSVSPILLPFDATLTQQPMSINSLLTSSSTAPFPPPLACYPGLKSSQLQQINAIEGPVFGLSSAPSASSFDPSCYPDRPIYGVLDVLRLRQPFFDTRSGIARQAAVLQRGVNPRVIIRNGAILSSLPGPSNVSTISVQQADPRQYGTLGQFNHVVLQYLSSIAQLEVATALVAYVLASASVQAIPPPSTSVLFTSLATIPILEVAVFGTVSPPDISTAASAFTTASGSLFFGSNQGTALRNWAITGCGSTTIWAESPLSPQVVRDNSFQDQIFNATWTAVSTALNNNIGVGLINDSLDELEALLSQKDSTIRELSSLPAVSRTGFPSQPIAPTNFKTSNSTPEFNGFYTLSPRLPLATHYQNGAPANGIHTREETHVPSQSDFSPPTHIFSGPELTPPTESSLSLDIMWPNWPPNLPGPELLHHL
ncbi:hypothetical protein C0991_000101 [Blastosporella zonata]|nr:hypothetical protein C0991_000101 [Blastosporella zonata]